MYEQPQERLPKAVMIDEHGVAKMLGCPVASVRKSHHEGRMPAPLRIGDQERWRVRELRHWVEDGCPAREEWKWSPDRRSF